MHMIVRETTVRKALKGEPPDEAGIYWYTWYAPYFEDYAVEAWERMTYAGARILDFSLVAYVRDSYVSPHP